jgi:hypothetical protein
MPVINIRFMRGSSRVAATAKVAGRINQVDDVELREYPLGPIAQARTNT